MLEFDPVNPVSAEANTLWSLADLIADCSNFQSLTYTENEVDARDFVAIGYSEPPWDGDKYTEPELAHTHCQCYLQCPLTGGYLVSTDDATTDPMEGGDLEMMVRAYVRKGQRWDRDNMYLSFTDQVAGLQKEILAKAMDLECPRLRDILRIAGPAWCARDEESAQGAYLYAVYLVSWGDVAQ